MKPRPLPSATRLRELFEYDPKQGALIYKLKPIRAGKMAVYDKRWNKRYAGKVAGTKDKNIHGYWGVRCEGARWRAHRIVWKMQTGEEPSHIDHINGHRSDNRWSNLRAADASLNSKNIARHRGSNTPYFGVNRDRNGKKWQARIGNGGLKHLGTFDCLADAIKARKFAEKDLDYHPNHGRRT